MSWTDERIEKLKMLWRGGVSTNQIARELGGVTSSSVIGKAYRLGLKPHPSGPSSTRSITVRNSSDPGLPTSPTFAVPSHVGVALMDLKRHHCRWPNGNVGTVDFSFCGANAINSKSYCGYHLGVARRKWKPLRGQ